VQKYANIFSIHLVFTATNAWWHSNESLDELSAITLIAVWILELITIRFYATVYDIGIKVVWWMRQTDRVSNRSIIQKSNFSSNILRCLLVFVKSVIYITKYIFWLKIQYVKLIASVRNLISFCICLDIMFI